MAVLSVADRVRGVELSNPDKEMFRIRIIDHGELTSVPKILLQWKENAHSLYEKALEQKNPEADRFLSAERIAGNVRTLIEYLSLYDNPSMFFVGCYDALSSHLQGIMLLYSCAAKNKIYIGDVLTNPIHISSNSSAGAIKISGIGTSLVHAAEKICVFMAYNKLSFTSLSSSKSFYLHLGFHEKQKSSVKWESVKMYKGRSEILMQKDDGAVHRR